MLGLLWAKHPCRAVGSAVGGCEEGWQHLAEAVMAFCAALCLMWALSSVPSNRSRSATRRAAPPRRGAALPEWENKGRKLTLPCTLGLCWAAQGLVSLCFAALTCLCSDCKQANSTCETDGACMVSVFNLDGVKHHVRTCIPEAKLIPAGKPFYCLSSEDLRNTHCCYSDFCNKIDLMVPSGEDRAGDTWRGNGAA